MAQRHQEEEMVRRQQEAYAYQQQQAAEYNRRQQQVSIGESFCLGLMVWDCDYMSLNVWD